VTDDRKPAEFRPARALHIGLARLLEGDIYLWMTREEFVVHLTEATKTFVSQDALVAIYNGLMSEAGVEPMLSENDKKHDAQAVRIEWGETHWPTQEEMDRIMKLLEQPPEKPIIKRPRKTIEEKLEEFKK
jgi:hypothetical protein